MVHGLSDVLERAEQALFESRQLLEAAELQKAAASIRIALTQDAVFHQREALSAIKIHRPDES
jgi:hypothetical protein